MSIPRRRENEKGGKTESKEQGMEADCSDRMSAPCTSSLDTLFKKYTCYLVVHDIGP